MGSTAVVDMSMVTPNQVSCLLAPSGASGLLQVDLLTLRRRQERVSNVDFHCSEVVQEVVSPVGSRSIATDGSESSGGDSANSQSAKQSTGPPVSPPRRLLKEIEVISLYRYDTNSDTVHCQQRSASFLLPSQQDPIALKLWQASQGRPVDVRFYDLVYTRS
jgi:hypothetical protein